MQKQFDVFFEGSLRRLMEIEWKNDVLDASILYRESQSGRHGQALVQEWEKTPTRNAGQQHFNIMNCAEAT